MKNYDAYKFMAFDTAFWSLIGLQASFVLLRNDFPPVVYGHYHDALIDNGYYPDAMIGTFRRYRRWNIGLRWY